MIKLLLTSDGISNKKLIEETKKLLDGQVSDCKALIVHTLVEKIQLKFVKAVEKQLLTLGIKKNNITRANITENISVPLKNFDIIYSCGGNTFYILDRMKKTGFDKYIKSFIKSGKLYIGVSAGSILVNSSIKGVDFGSQGDSNDINLKNLKALNILKLFIFPHYENNLSVEIKELKKIVNSPVQIIKDGEAVIVLGNKITKI